MPACTDDAHIPERAEEEAKRASHERFKALRLSKPGGDELPADYYDHTQFSETHENTRYKPGTMYRPSLTRVGTTPQERIAAAAMMERTNRELVASAAARQSLDDHLAAASAVSGEYVAAAVDLSRPGRSGGPSHYNIPATSGGGTTR